MLKTGQKAPLYEPIVMFHISTFLVGLHEEYALSKYIAIRSGDKTEPGKRRNLYQIPHTSNHSIQHTQRLNLY